MERWIVRQLFDAESSTFTYLIADTASGDAALVDPVRGQVARDLRLIEELGLTLRYVLETHVHADHVTAAGALRSATKARTVCGLGGAECADMQLAHGEVLRLGSLAITVLATPGHTDDSVSYLVEDIVFTGDALLVRGTGRTDFQNGDAGALYDSITRVLFKLPDDTRVLPAQDYRGFTSTTIGEEKRLNARVAGKSRDAFVALMNTLDLPPPKRLAEAVPANRGCGESAAPQGATP